MFVLILIFFSGYVQFIEAGLPLTPNITTPRSPSLVSLPGLPLPTGSPREPGYCRPAENNQTSCQWLKYAGDLVILTIPILVIAVVLLLLCIGVLIGKSKNCCGGQGAPSPGLCIPDKTKLKAYPGWEILTVKIAAILCLLLGVVVGFPIIWNRNKDFHAEYDALWNEIMNAVKSVGNVPVEYATISTYAAAVTHSTPNLAGIEEARNSAKALEDQFKSFKSTSDTMEGMRDKAIMATSITSCLLLLLGAIAAVMANKKARTSCATLVSKKLLLMSVFCCLMAAVHHMLLMAVYDVCEELDKAASGQPSAFRDLCKNQNFCETPSFSTLNSSLNEMYNYTCKLDESRNYKQCCKCNQSDWYEMPATFTKDLCPGLIVSQCEYNRCDGNCPAEVTTYTQTDQLNATRLSYRVYQFLPAKVQPMLYCPIFVRVYFGGMRSRCSPLSEAISNIRDSLLLLALILALGSIPATLGIKRYLNSKGAHELRTKVEKQNNGELVTKPASGKSAAPVPPKAAPKSKPKAAPAKPAPGGKKSAMTAAPATTAAVATGGAVAIMGASKPMANRSTPSAPYNNLASDSPYGSEAPLLETDAPPYYNDYEDEAQTVPAEEYEDYGQYYDPNEQQYTEPQYDQEYQYEQEGYQDQPQEYAPDPYINNNDVQLEMTPYMDQQPQEETYQPYQ